VKIAIILCANVSQILHGLNLILNYENISTCAKNELLFFQTPYPN
jgi:hypothetical protein